MDENCDEIIDNMQSMIDWYFDGDGDGYGTTSDHHRMSNPIITPELGIAMIKTMILPTCSGICNGENEDCDESIDEDAIDRDNWYIDLMKMASETKIPLF